MNLTKITIVAASFLVFNLNAYASHPLEGSYTHHKEPRMKISVTSEGNVTTNISFKYDGEFYEIRFPYKLIKNPSVPIYRTQGVSKVTLITTFPNTLTCQVPIYLALRWEEDLRALIVSLTGPTLVSTAANVCNYFYWSTGEGLFHPTR